MFSRNDLFLNQRFKYNHLAGIYIHIPFCKQACFYCDFHFSVNQSYKGEMVDAILRELEIQKDYLGNEVIKTIYFGGGTPSLLSRHELETIQDQIFKFHQVSDVAEITLEANPDDLPYRKLEELRNSGVNRLSIGIQTFDSNTLKMLNRAHSAAEARECLSLAREVGFKNISIDLIYGIPGRNDNLWIEDLQEAMHYRPEHISTYSLTVEPNTVFGRRLRKNEFPEPDEEHSAGQFEIMTEQLKEAGYDHYEISNFCLPGHHSRHNSSYWQQQNYLGTGPGAHSYDGATRQFNISNNGKYMKALSKGVVPFEREVLNQKDKVNEYLLTTLRTQWGADLNRLREEFNIDLLADKGDYIHGLVNSNLVMITNQCLVLTNNGKLLADKISSDLFID